MEDAYSLAEPTRVVMSVAAKNIGSHRQAAQHIRAALAFHHNPLKLFYAHSKLSELLLAGDEAAS
jgi:hypothetical protein